MVRRLINFHFLEWKDGRKGDILYMFWRGWMVGRVIYSVFFFSLS